MAVPVPPTEMAARMARLQQALAARELDGLLLFAPDLDLQLKSN